MRLFQRTSLKHTIFFSILAVILFISAAIAFLARWILVSSLTGELLHRGTAIAQSIADRGSGFILDKDTPQLVSLVFDTAQLGERRHLVAYIYIADTENRVLAHTFTRPFPEFLHGANLVPQDQESSTIELDVFGKPVYDIAVPAKEGIYRIGQVHVGLNKAHIDSLVGKLRITFLGFISLIILIIFFVSLKLAESITRPLQKLTDISDEISRGNFDIDLVDLGNEGWHPLECPAYRDTDLPCWHFDQTLAARAAGESGSSAERLHTCRRCRFYSKRDGDEVTQLGDSFRNMVWSIKLYRRRLRESEEKYRSLFDSGPDPVLVVDHESMEILDANPRATELYGYSREELAGRPFSDLDPDFRLQCLGRFDADEPNSPGEPDETSELGGGADRACVYCTKVLHYKKDGEPFYVNLHACPISYKGRQAIIVAATDITEMIEKDAQLIQASKMKTLGEMSAGIAHEINQPLNAIKMGSEFLTMMTEQGQEIPGEHLVQVTREISTQVDRATEIINTLRAFGRKAHLLKEKVDPNASIRGVLNIVGQQLALSNIRLDLDLDPAVSRILAHDNRLQQVLFNLVTNARDAILAKDEQAGGVISIRTRNEGDHVLIQVADTGIGISKEARDKVFEPFFTTKETGQGMGLGLSISYGIVKDYQGDINIESEEGSGSTFTLSFPRAA